jgi:diguanylate cyclase (GGDEF)-like protein/putative nucleotidyltransferase with HDIG domain
VQHVQPTKLPNAAKVFIAAVGILGILGLFLTFNGWVPQVRPRFLFYLLLALASSRMRVSFPGMRGSISTNYVFSMLGLLELQVPETMILAILGAAAQISWRSAARLAHLFFNTTSMSLTVLASAAVYKQPWFGNGPEAEVLRLTLAGVVFFVVNTVPLSIVIALTENRGAKAVWQGLYNWLFCYYVVGVSLAEIVHYSSEKLGWAFTLSLLPLLYLVYRSFSLYLERLEQEKTYAEGTASLHLRTIEALAMAIEAKDQCTHDHLRRVQVYSVELAKELGLPAEEIKALQAASILHDIGKLAVPDYIISKPGKLTPEEFEKMKVHTIVGAAILEQVAFPYAVAPIVRSHHEKWDGSGYPDGIKEEKIPIGARILSAVDCLDALASDRQYRRALPLDEAMDYVASLAGRSFDPKVVEILKNNYRDFERLAQSTPMQTHRLSIKDLVVGGGHAPDAGFEKIADSSFVTGPDVAVAPGASIASARQEMQTILELTQDLGGSLRPEELLSVIANRLKQVVPYDCISVYVREGDILKPKYVNGENSRMFAALQIPVGQGLSGWVVENGKPIVNGNPSVEPGYLNDPAKFSVLNSALSVPLRNDSEHITGALTLYRAEKDSYTTGHLGILEAINGKIARALDSSIELQRTRHEGNVDSLTGLPNAKSLLAYLQEELRNCEANQKMLAVLLCDLDDFKRMNDRFGHITGDEFLKRVAGILQSNRRSSDYVARMAGDEFVVLLAGAHRRELGRRIESLDGLVRAASREIFGDEEVGISIGVACFPEDGKDVDTLLSNADADMSGIKRARKAADGAVLQLARSLK